MNFVKRVMIIGNGGGGKTTLAHALAKSTGLPLYEVDPIQFQPNWQRTPLEEVSERLQEIQAQETWIIDGFGPWDCIEARASLADTIIFVDHPIWVHFWWAAERQIAAAKGEQRLGGPEGCDLNSITKLMFETIWRVHEEIRPRLMELFETAWGWKPEARIGWKPMPPREFIWIRSPEQLDEFMASLP